MTFAEILKGARLNKGFTQKRLAYLIRVDQRTILKYEQGRLPRYEHLRRLCDALDISADYLMGRVS